MAVTLVDIAKRLNVSHMTVSRALNKKNDPFISEATRKRVLEVARELGYRPNRLARSLVGGRTCTIGIAGIALGDTFEADVVWGVHEVCQTRNYHPFLMQTEPGKRGLLSSIRLLLEHQVDGVICKASGLSLDQIHEAVDEVMASGIPCVVVDDRSVSGKVDCVYSDDFHGMDLMIGHLVKLGHRRIAHLSCGNANSPSRDRRDGYCAALRAHGIELGDLPLLGSEWNDRQIVDNMEKLLGLPKPPTAVVMVNDYLAGTVINLIRDRGLRVPEDIAIVGYGNTALAHFLRMTTIDQNAHQMGSIAVQRLFERMKSPELPVEDYKAPVQLVVRETCGAKLK